MAIIDTFVKLMLDKRAERLVLVADEIPFLLRAGETIELSMPALGAATIGRIAGEIGCEGASRAPREGLFRTADGEEFRYSTTPHGAQCRIEIHAGTASGPVQEQPAAVPPVQATPQLAATVAPAVSSLARPDPALLAVIDHAVSLQATDIFLSSGKAPRMRRNGTISLLDAPAPEQAQILQLLPSEALRREFERGGSADFAVRWDLSDGSRRIRVNVFRHLEGVAAALRPMRRSIPSLAELHLPKDLLHLVAFPSGLVLVAGTSGSGKSTTLAALIDHLNHTCARHIITIEDPIEYEHRDSQCLIHQREVGANVASFSVGLRAALRENPDVILLGEVRDLPTIAAALTAAETGHLVLATLHSGSATAAINRIVDVFPGHQQAHIRTQLSLSLRAVVSQRLVPSRSKGLVPALERLVVTPAIANGIREGQDHFMRNTMLTGGDEGMVTLERSLANLVRERLIDRDTAFRHAADPKALEHLLG